MTRPAATNERPRVFASFADMAAVLCGVMWQDFRGDGSEYQGYNLRDLRNDSEATYSARWVHTEKPMKRDEE